MPWPDLKENFYITTNGTDKKCASLFSRFDRTITTACLHVRRNALRLLRPTTLIARPEKKKRPIGSITPRAT
jgi:hypothetical protein